MHKQAETATAGSSTPRLQVPKIEVPKGGGAIRSLGENFEVNPSTGTASLRVPIALPTTVRELPLELSLSYDSGRGNGPFGVGWGLDLPSITRKTDRRIPTYGADDVFQLAGVEDLVPALDDAGDPICFPSGTYEVCRFMPRVEASFQRIERWVETTSGDVHWRVTDSQNVTQVFGKTVEGRIDDPALPGRTFSWLLQEIHDDRGNVVRFDYKQEDGRQILAATASEAHRFRSTENGDEFLANAQRYVKRIHFGNSTPFQASDFRFQLVFDYGEHEDTPDERHPWPVRPDPFSTYRSSFEIRSYRRCARILLFHQFPELGAEPVLVRSYDFTYAEDRHISKLISVVQRGYRKDLDNGTYETASYPALEFDYTSLSFDTEVRSLEASSLVGIPGGVEGRQNQWVDLDGEGLPGILTAHADSWSYKRNLGKGQFEPPRPLETLPSPRNLGRGPQRLQDLDGSGQLSLVQFEAPLQGYFARTKDQGWERFQALPTLPRLDWNSPHLRFMDVDGDGLSDLLLSSDRGFEWYQGKGKEGFAPGGFVPRAPHEDEGPVVVFADASHSIHLADMSGDGLLDIVRIRNGEVCYWPNLGYGRFGPKVTMERSPVFAPEPEFDPKRIRLADIDGSGTADIIYLGKSMTLYRNEAGNGWSEGLTIPELATKDSLSEISVVDLLGTGTSCIVRSSWAPADRHQPVRYIDLLGGRKPHLLEAIRNNFGGEIRLHYAPSTKFYLEDAKKGEPWLTRLHFPVHVVERVEKEDRITGNKLVTRYRYKHGYYDGIEREFRGFARVDKWDAESFRQGESEPGIVLPPVHTKTWFHTGVAPKETSLEEALSSEFYRPDGETVPPASLLPDSLDSDEVQEAARALRGKILREEIYAEDGSPEEGLPYLMTENRYQVCQIQPKASNRHGVYFPYLIETLEDQLERRPDDGRRKQRLILEVDEYGNALREAEVAFPRAQTADPIQGKALVRVTERSFAHSPDNADWYRHSLPVRETTYELTDWSPTEKRLDLNSFHALLLNTPKAAFHEDTSGRIVLRELEETLTHYMDDQQGGPLPEGEIDSLALPYDTYRKAFTNELLDQAYDGRVAHDLLAEGGYVEIDDAYWAPTGCILYDASKFYLPFQFIDSLGGITRVSYDPSGLLLERTTDPVGNVIEVEFDYQSLQPSRIRDQNSNDTLCAYDALGFLKQLARRGKGEGDDLSDPTVDFTYDLDAWQRDGEPLGLARVRNRNMETTRSPARPSTPTRAASARR